MNSINVITGFLFAPTMSSNSVSSQVIFCSNQDPLFGNMSAGHDDELWSPSKDVTSSPLGTTPLSGDSTEPSFGALRAAINQSEVKAEYMPDTSQTLGYEKLNEITSCAPQDVQASLDIIEHFGGKSNLLGKQKVQRTKSLISCCRFFLFSLQIHELLWVSLACIL